jgi:hypothetical protein
MAKAGDTTSTSHRISWDEALARAGSSEALLSFLRGVPVPAWHQGLHYLANGREMLGPGDFDPAWWAEARFDPATRRVIFLMDNIVSGMIASDRLAELPKDEVFALGVELERGVIEARFSEERREDEKEKGRQLRRAQRALKKLRGDGKAPDDAPTNVVEEWVANELEADSKRLGLAAPSWDTVNRALGRDKKGRNKK